MKDDSCIHRPGGGICPACRKRVKLTRHHIVPKRAKKEGRGEIGKICRDCHDSLEDYIRGEERKVGGRLSHDEYRQTWKDFLLNAILPITIIIIIISVYINNP